MKVYGSLIALCLYQANAWQSTAFSPRTRTVALNMETPMETPIEVSGGAPAYSLKDTPTFTGLEPSVGDRQISRHIDAAAPVTIQGGALRTWSVKTTEVDRMLVSMHTSGPPEGLPLVAHVQLCQGPNNTPVTMKIKSGKGRLRPVRFVVETPGDASSLFIRNIGDLEFPITARVQPATDGVGDVVTEDGLVEVSSSIYDMPNPKRLQGGGAVASWPFEASVNKVKVWLTTDGRPLNAAIELTQGPNAVKVLIELYTEDGLERPFFTVIETPGSGNMMRVWSTGNMEFPLEVAVEPFIEA